ncbi:MAG: alpha/beta fold hydrolase [Myxococcota bacterium]
MEANPETPRLHIEVRGEGPLLVWAHGFGGSARNFRPQWRRFSERFRCVIYDARGHARSDAPPNAHDYSIALLCEDLGRVLDATDPAPAFVGGLSLGAATALAFARARPERIRGLILASYPASRGAGPGGFSRVARAFADRLDADGLEAAGSEFVWGPSSGLDARGADLVRQGFLEHPPHAMAHMLRGVVHALPTPEDLAEALRAKPLPLPVLLIAGAEDAGSLAASRTLADALPSAELVVVPEAGHVVNLQAPAAFDAAVEAFLAREG